MKYLLLVCLALVGCGQRVVTPRMIDTATALCAPNGGLGVIRHGNLRPNGQIEVWGDCANGDEFYNKKVAP